MAKKPTLSRHLRDARLQRGLSVAEVAERAGFSVASIYLWETGKAHPGDRSKVFGTLTMPNGQRIKTMREDAFRAALAASGQRGAR